MTRQRAGYLRRAVERWRERRPSFMIAEAYEMTDEQMREFGQRFAEAASRHNLTWLS